jgi:hypothetical protein
MPGVSEAKDYLDIGASSFGDAMYGAWNRNLGSEKSVGWGLSGSKFACFACLPEIE